MTKESADSLGTCTKSFSRPNRLFFGGTHVHVGAFMADLAGRRSVLFPKIQREAGET